MAFYFCLVVLFFRVVVSFVFSRKLFVWFVFVCCSFSCVTLCSRLSSFSAFVCLFVLFVRCLVYHVLVVVFAFLWRFVCVIGIRCLCVVCIVFCVFVCVVVCLCRCLFVYF